MTLVCYLVLVSRPSAATCPLATTITLKPTIGLSDMRAYYYDGEPGDQRLPHDSGRTVSTEMLEALNVQSMFVPVESYEEEVAAIAKQQGYKNHDIISISKEGLGDVRASFARRIKKLIPVQQYESRIKAFFHEYVFIVHPSSAYHFAYSSPGICMKMTKPGT